MSNIASLRKYMKEQGFHGVIIPRTDEYQSEYLAPYAERVEWVSGFNGSAGLAIVTLDSAVLFVDGRYTLQVRQQTDNAVFDYADLSEKEVAKWLKAHLNSGDRLGYDAALHTHKKLDVFLKSCAQVGAELIDVSPNPVDECWLDQPPKPASMAIAHPLQYSGESSSDKCQRMGKKLSDNGAAAFVLTMPDCIAWLLNVRGDDTPCVPVVLSKAILYSDGKVDWCIDTMRIGFSLKEHCGDHVHLISEKDFELNLNTMGSEGVKVMIDEATIPAKYYNLLNKDTNNLLYGNPVLLAKSCKNAIELDNAHSVHIQDGVALVSLLAWLDAEVENTSSSDSSVCELSIVDKLLSFRKIQPTFRDISFDTISGFAGNGAIVHYQSTKGTNKELQKNGLFLLDSGGQYLGGTTDVTRTVVVGVPNAEQKDRFTRVLQGHISISTCCFPSGTSGHQIDAMARRALWNIGMDYAHGTGHGVGSYLGVHEGPQRISSAPNEVALKEGMIVSNEPGYYKEGEYGIRIENLVVVKKSEKYEGFLEFENLTMAPIDRRLIDKALLSKQEIEWVNNYHQEVFDKISSHLDDNETLEWLKKATQAI